MSLGQYLNPKNYLRYLVKRIAPYGGCFPPNYIVDKMINSVDFTELKKLDGVEVDTLNINSDQYYEWVNTFFPSWKTVFNHIEHKKLLELYSTFKLLDLRPSDVYLDAAGGRYTYINQLKCSKKILQDLHISEQFKTGMSKDVELLECGVSQISLEDEGVDKISCHHSFEHFQGDADIMFIREVQRLLRPKGRCCIIQVFIADHYVEITDKFSFDLRFDSRAKQIIDPSAAIPGGNGCGNFARVYDLQAFQQRIVNNIDTTRFKVELLELRMGNKVLPDLSLTCHKRVTAVNRPFRVLSIEKL